MAGLIHKSCTFITEVVPNDVTAVSVAAALVVLEPWTGVGTRAAISGFANPATVTIITMYMLSAGMLASVITPVATAELMIPVGVSAVNSRLERLVLTGEQVDFPVGQRVESDPYRG